MNDRLGEQFYKNTEMWFGLTSWKYLRCWPV